MTMTASRALHRGDLRRLGDEDPTDGWVALADAARLMSLLLGRMVDRAEAVGADVGEEDSPAFDLVLLQGVVQAIEDQIAPTHVRSSSDVIDTPDLDPDDSDMQLLLGSLRELVGKMPAGQRPASGAEGRAVCKARRKRIDDLLGLEQGPLAFDARADEEHYLYLVQYGDWQKFGRGTARRVVEHSAANVIQVRRGRFADVEAAETVLKRRFKKALHPTDLSCLPRSFCRGREVIPASVQLDLSEVLPGGDDVTDAFRRPMLT